VTLALHDLLMPALADLLVHNAHPTIVHKNIQFRGFFFYFLNKIDPILVIIKIKKKNLNFHRWIDCFDDWVRTEYGHNLLAFRLRANSNDDSCRLEDELPCGFETQASISTNSNYNLTSHACSRGSWRNRELSRGVLEYKL